MRKLIFLFAAFVLLTSCEKEDVTPTQGEINAKQLKHDVESYNIIGVTIYEVVNDEYQQYRLKYYEKEEFSIEKQFVTIMERNSYKVTYDLNSLLKYEIDYEDDIISLYFEN